MKKSAYSTVAFIACNLFTSYLFAIDPSAQMAAQFCQCMNSNAAQHDSLENLALQSNDIKVTKNSLADNYLSNLEELFKCMNTLEAEPELNNEDIQTKVFEYVYVHCNRHAGNMLFDNVRDKTTIDDSGELKLLTPDEYVKQGVRELKKENYFQAQNNFDKAIGLDKNFIQTNIIVDQLFKTGQYYIQKAEEHEKASQEDIAGEYRDDAHTILTMAFDFTVKDKKAIGNAIYYNLLKAGDTTEAALYEKYK